MELKDKLFLYKNFEVMYISGPQKIMEKTIMKNLRRAFNFYISITYLNSTSHELLEVLHIYSLNFPF